MHFKGQMVTKRKTTTICPTFEAVGDKPLSVEKSDNILLHVDSWTSVVDPISARKMKLLVI